MNEREEAALADLLRKALHEEAARQVPAGDGLSLIRDRVQARGRFSWARPVLVMGAVAAVAAAAAVIPASLRHGGPDHTSNSAAGGSVERTTSSLVAPSAPHTVTAEGATPDDATATTLPSAAGVADMRTVWPYGSRAQGYYHAAQDVRSGQHPELFDPSLTAISFVHRYVGDDIKLVPGPSARTSSGVSVVVSRVLPNGTVHAVTRVQLVPVSRQQKAPWVVAAADRPYLLGIAASDPAAKDPQAQNSLSATAPYQVRSGTNQIQVTGSIGRPAGKDLPQVKVELFDAEGTSLSFNRAVVTQDDPANYSWNAQINADPDQVSQAASIAAWTLDENADVLELVALPAPVVQVATSGASQSSPGEGSPSQGDTPASPNTNDPTAIPSATR